MTSNAALSSEAVAFADRIGELVASMRSAEAKLGALLVEALAPATGAAALAGRLSNPMIDTITNVLTQVPPQHCASAETNLLTFAEEAGYKQVAALGARILAHLAPDGPAPDDTEPVAPTREVFLRRK
ncbi:MAG TPA: DUF222 domain-containing protein, partial [Amycolatopsis sp.]